MFSKGFFLFLACGRRKDASDLIPNLLWESFKITDVVLLDIYYNIQRDVLKDTSSMLT